MLHKGAFLRAPELGEDLMIDGIARRDPGGERPGKGALPGEPHAAIDRHPAHQAGVEKFLAAATHFPNSLVRLLPVFADPINEADEVLPKVMRDRRAPFIVEINGVQELAMDVELELIPGGIADANRLRAAISAEMREDLLG